MVSGSLVASLGAATGQVTAAQMRRDVTAVCVVSASPAHRRAVG
jgi:hypothetical protein